MSKYDNKTMSFEGRARMIEEGSRLAGELIRTAILRPRKSQVPTSEEAAEKTPEKEVVGKPSLESENPPILASESHPKPPTSVMERRELDQETLAYQENRVLGEIYLLEDHLKAGCHECGEASDCCWKHADKAARYAHETMSMTTDPFWKNLYDLAIEIKAIVHPDDVKADTYSSDYPRYAVSVSEFRRPLQQKAMQKAKPALTLEEAKAEASKLAEQEVEKLWQSQEKI